MEEKTEAEERCVKDDPSGIDPEQVGGDPEQVGVVPGPGGGKTAGQGDGTGPAEDELTMLRAEAASLRERLTAAEEENRRLAESCRQARSERDEAVRRAETLCRETVLRRYLAEKGLPGDTADIALRGLSAEEVRLEDGGLAAESREMLDGLMDGPFRPLFRMGARDGDGGLRGVALDRPPPDAGLGSMSREEILSIRDGAERRRAMLDNPGAFGL